MPFEQQGQIQIERHTENYFGKVQATPTAWTAQHKYESISQIRCIAHSCKSISHTHAHSQCGSRENERRRRCHGHRWVQKRRSGVLGLGCQSNYNNWKLNSTTCSGRAVCLSMPRSQDLLPPPTSIFPHPVRRSARRPLLLLVRPLGGLVLTSRSAAWPFASPPQPKT